MMKVCPICGARAFDDAAVCYGCLYQFDGGTPDEVGLEEDGERRGEAYGAPVVGAPEFLIRFRPAFDDAGCVTWSCAVETRPH